METGCAGGSGKREPGPLCALSPLMAGASEQVVLQALDTILRTATPPQQSNLLSILTTFSEPWVSTEHILQLVGKERLMESKIWNTLLAEAMDDIKARVVEETETEFAQKLASIEAEYQAKVAEYKAEVEERTAEAEKRTAEVEERTAEAEERTAEAEAYKAQAEQAARLHINDMQQALENALITRFPQAPVRLMRDIRQLSQSSQFNDLIIALVAVQDEEEFEQKLQEVLHVGKN